MTLEELKQRALSLVEVPEHYQLEIEDYMENEDTSEEGEALFTWSDPKTKSEEGIMITLGKNGNLIDLTVEVTGAAEGVFSIPCP